MIVDKEEFDEAISYLQMQEVLLMTDGEAVIAYRLLNIINYLKKSIKNIQSPCPFCLSKSVVMVDRGRIGWSGYCYKCQSFGVTDDNYEIALNNWNSQFEKENYIQVEKRKE